MRIDLRNGELDFINSEEREHQAVRLIRQNKKNIKLSPTC